MDCTKESPCEIHKQNPDYTRTIHDASPTGRAATRKQIEEAVTRQVLRFALDHTKQFEKWLESEFDNYEEDIAETKTDVLEVAYELLNPA
jgi:hypothetical protein